MHLAEYLRTKEIKLAEFATRIGRSPATVSRLANGKQQPDWDTVKAIRRATKGAVTANDFDIETAA